MGVSITGWAHSKFGKSELNSAESLIASVTQAALDDANIGARRILMPFFWVLSIMASENRIFRLHSSH